jgi:hypothetical protein
VLGLPYVAAFVAHIARVRIESQVRWIHAKFIRPTGALMTNLKSIWYQTFAQQPRGTIGRERPKSLLAATYLPVSPCREARLPQPAFVGPRTSTLLQKRSGKVRESPCAVRYSGVTCSPVILSFLNPSRLTGALGFFLLSHNAIIRSS